MLSGLKPITGAILIAAFITACLGWLFHGMDVVVPWWSYAMVFSMFALGLIAVATLLLGTARKGDSRRRPVGMSIEE